MNEISLRIKNLNPWDLAYLKTLLDLKDQAKEKGLEAPLTQIAEIFFSSCNSPEGKQMLLDFFKEI